jgi:hypothetical protein
MGVVIRVLSLYSGRRKGADVADQAATLMLRGLLVDPSRLEEVRRAAHAGLESAAQPTAR